jgi:hypothetical protein
MDAEIQEPAGPPSAEYKYFNPVMPAADAHAFSLSKNVYLEHGRGFFGYQGDNKELIIYKMGTSSRYSLKLGETGENIEFSKMTVGFPKGNKAWGGGFFSQGEHIPKHQTLQLILDTDQGKKKYNVAFPNTGGTQFFLDKFKGLNHEYPNIFTARKRVIDGNASLNDVDKLKKEIKDMSAAEDEVPPPASVGGGRKKNKSKKKSKKRRKSKSKKRRKSKSKKRRKSKSKKRRKKQI